MGMGSGTFVISQTGSSILIMAILVQNVSCFATLSSGLAVPAVAFDLSKSYVIMARSQPHSTP